MGHRLLYAINIHRKATLSISDCMYHVCFVARNCMERGNLRIRSRSSVCALCMTSQKGDGEKLQRNKKKFSFEFLDDDHWIKGNRK